MFYFAKFLALYLSNLIISRRFSQNFSFKCLIKKAIINHYAGSKSLKTLFKKGYDNLKFVHSFIRLLDVSRPPSSSLPACAC